MKKGWARILCMVCMMPLLATAACAAVSMPSSSAAGTGAPEEATTIVNQVGNMTIGALGEARLEWQGISRLYSYYIPSTFNGKRMPLLFALHGSGGNAAIQLEYGNYVKIAEREGFIVVATNAVAIHPAGDERATFGNLSCEGYTSADIYGAEEWFTHSPYVRPSVSIYDPLNEYGIDDVGFHCALVDLFVGEGLADGNRVFASGMSYGGFLAIRLAHDAADRFAGIASVAGLMLGEHRGAMPAGPVKLVFFHSADDAVVPHEGVVFPAATVPPDGVWALSLDEGISWFLTQYGYDTVMETSVTQLPPKSERDAARITRYEYNGGAAVKYWITGEDYQTGGAGHTWPGSVATVKSSQQVQATELIWQELRIELLQEIPSASLEQLDDGTNELTLQVVKKYDNGKEDTVTAVYVVQGDATGNYQVDDYAVFVYVESETGLLEWHIVS